MRENKRGVFCVEVPDHPDDRCPYRKGVSDGKELEKNRVHKSTLGVEEDFEDLQMFSDEKACMEKSRSSLSSQQQMVVGERSSCRSVIVASEVV